LAAVLAVFWTYALAVAPWIDPPSRTELVSDQPVGGGGSSRDFSKLFPPGSWELKRPKVLETDQGTLLFDDYRTEPSGALRLTRCSLISHLASGEGSDRRESDRLLVMQASDGALLEFDKPLNLARGEFGDFVRGRLLGDIRIFSPASDDEADDALLVVTRNVQIEPQRIWAPNTVEFQYGPHRVSGRDLSIQLSKPSPTDDSQDLAVGQIQSVELVHVDQVKLLLNSDAWSTVTGPAAANAPPADERKSKPKGAPTPVDMHCTGPFRFDFRKFVGSLEERVDVIRHYPNGTSDQLSCELLEFHLRKTSHQPGDEAISKGPTGLTNASSAAGSTEANPAARRTPKVRQLEPSRIVALGFPAMLRVPSMQAGARAGRFEYDFLNRRVILHDPHQTILHNDLYEVRAPDIEYELNPSGGLGRLRASGPGQMVGRIGESGRALEAHWRGEVTLLPQDDHHVLSVSAVTHVAVAQTGTLQADQVHLYLNELPPDGKGQPRIVLDRLLAIGRVHVDSPRLLAELEEARLWFRYPAGQAAEAKPAAKPAAEHATVSFVESATGSTTQATKLKLTATLLQGQILLANPAALEELHVQGNVRLRELAKGRELAHAPQPGSHASGATNINFIPAGGEPVAMPQLTALPPVSAPSGIDLSADQWILEGLQTREPQAVFVGRPARLSAQGMAVVGDLIRVNQGQNWAEVQGQGSLTLQPKQLSSTALSALPAGPTLSNATVAPANPANLSSVSVSPPSPGPYTTGVLPLPPQGSGNGALGNLASPTMTGDAQATLEPLTVSWQQGMQFDGRTAKFETAVRAEGGYLQPRKQRLQFQTYGPLLEVVLNQRLDFSRPQSAGPLDIETLTYLGPVEVESQTWDAQQQLIGRDSLRTRDLRFERATGRLTGQGPGGQVVHRGPRSQATPFGATLGSPAANRVPTDHPFSTASASPGSSVGPPGGPWGAAPPSVANGPPGFQPAGFSPAPTSPQPWSTASPTGVGPTGNPLDLVYLQVDFQGQMRGNLYQRDLEFLENVRTVYGPIASWDDSLATDRPLDLRDHDILVTSRRLAIVDMGSAVGRESAIELEATGNAVVRGRLFTASGERLSYARAKDQLILEGDGRSDSTLEFRRHPTAAAQQLRAGKILFYPQSQQFALQDFQALNLTDLGQLRPNGQ
jgi:hypothetical protein